MAVPIPAFCGTRAIGIQDKEDLKSKRLYCVLAQVEKTCANGVSGCHGVASSGQRGLRPT